MQAYVMKWNEALYLKKYSCDYNNSNAGGQREHILLNYIVKFLKMLNNITHLITITHKIKYNFLLRKIILNNRFFLSLFSSLSYKHCMICPTVHCWMTTTWSSVVRTLGNVNLTCFWNLWTCCLAVVHHIQVYKYI